MTGYVYLLHFDAPVSPGHPCRHYVGFTENLASRIQDHQTGGSRGARLMQVVKERRIPWRVARVWHGDRNFERSLKNRKEGPRLCPVCNPGARLGATDLSTDEIEDQLLPF